MSRQSQNPFPRADFTVPPALSGEGFRGSASGTRIPPDPRSLARTRGAARRVPAPTRSVRRTSPASSFPVMGEPGGFRRPGPFPLASARDAGGQQGRPPWRTPPALAPPPKGHHLAAFGQRLLHLARHSRGRGVLPFQTSSHLHPVGYTIRDGMIDRLTDRILRVRAGGTFMRTRTAAVSAFLILCTAMGSAACSSPPDDNPSSRPSAPDVQRTSQRPADDETPHADAPTCATSSEKISEDCVVDMDIAEMDEATPATKPPATQVPPTK